MSKLFRITGCSFVSIEYSSEIVVRVPDGTTKRDLANIEDSLLNQLLKDDWEAEESEVYPTVDSIDVQEIDEDDEDEEDEEGECFELEKDQDGHWIRKH